ncbi:MAG: uracil-DNA glycosylase family protein [Pseudomonadota bacterium]
MAHPLLASIDALNAQLRPVRFPAPVACVYNPLVYALGPYKKFLSRYGKGEKRCVFLGMNPGPYGMAQTGVPFGEVSMVRDWMSIEAPVNQPPVVHPKRPIEGFACQRSEVSGRRFWGLMAQRYPDPRAFFADHFVLNYCPLVWMSDTGKNLTPDKIPRAQMTRVAAACDGFLSACLDYYRPEIVIGVGVFAEKQAKRVCADRAVTVGRMLHPSPASPIANRHWPDKAIEDLRKLGVWSAR